MRISSFLPVLASGLAYAASWSFEDGSLTVLESKTSSDSAPKKFTPEKPLGAITLQSTGSIKLALTVTNGGKARRAHQVFLTLGSPDSGLEESFPLEVQEGGKAKLHLTQTKIPTALLSSKAPLLASIVIGSFGSSTPYKSGIFSLSTPATGPPPPVDASSVRYAALPEIHHIFRSDPSSPVKILTLVFTLAVLACIPALFLAWLQLGANLNHVSKAFAAAPTSHALFYGSVVGMEFVFWKYYTSWNLFQTLPVAGVVGLIAFLSGSGALSEVQERRLKGER